MARSVLQGTPLSPGIAIGPLRLLPDSRIFEKRAIGEEEVESEIGALQEASLLACAKLRNTIASVPENLSEYREIVALQMELARDPRILNGAMARIRHRKICAAWAVSETISELAALFQSMADPYLADRAHDIRTIGQCLLTALCGCATPVNSGEPGILAAYDLSPASVMESAPGENLGLITVEGGATSHIAILARGLKVPAIGGLSALFREARNNEIIILDALSGQVVIGPDPGEIEYYRDRQKSYAAFETEARQSAQKPAITLDGAEIIVRANLESQQEMHELLRCGAEGIGLFRTEFGWLRGNDPDEETLFREYRAVLKGAAPAMVIFRTLDVGADKVLPVQEALYEPNPALGLRGIRFCLSHREIFRPQLRALLRAGAGEDLSIMLPMVTTVQEVREFRELLKEIEQELSAEGLEHASHSQLGVMVETPAAVFICEELADECDFLSLGTNDLIHYIMAIDRNNRHVSYLHDPLHPAFLRAIRKVADACHSRGKRVSVCGELAADQVGIALLIGLGVDVLSATPRFVPSIKHTIRKLDRDSCRRIAEAALRGESEATRQMLQNEISACIGSGQLLQNSLLTGPRST